MYHALKLILLIGLIVLGGYFVEQILPWWSAVCLAGILCFAFNTKMLESFLCGLLAMGGLWLVLAWNIHISTEGRLSNKMAALFGLQDPMFLIVATGVIGGITTGLGALSGSALRSIWRKKKKTRKFYG